MVRSKALEINIADYHVDVTIDEKYSILQEVMSKYYGIIDGDKPDMESLSKEMQDFAKTTNVILGKSLYSDSWLEL